MATNEFIRFSSKMTQTCFLRYFLQTVNIDYGYRAKSVIAYIVGLRFTPLI
jgi:hypothetical protein